MGRRHRHWALRLVDIVAFYEYNLDFAVVLEPAARFREGEMVV